MNHDDSAFNRHPNPAKGCAESVNWNLKGAEIFILFFGVEMFAGIDESQKIIPIAVILSLAVGLILVNNYEK